MEETNTQLAEIENWEVLCGFLPRGWAEQARRLGAIQRARYISDPGTVLRILLLHLATGCSLAETAARASASGLAQISAVGVYKRLRAAEPWLRWLAQQMRGAADVPMEMAGRRLRAVDATWVSEPGSTGSSWKVHWAVNLAKRPKWTFFVAFFLVRRAGTAWHFMPGSKPLFPRGNRPARHFKTSTVA